MPDKKMSLPTLIWLLLALFIVRAFIYASFTPPWQGPDEPLHYDYIHYLQTEKKLPVLGKTVLCKKVNISLSHFYFNIFLKNKSPYAVLKNPKVKESHRYETEHGKEGLRQNQIVQHPPLYYLIAATISYPFKDSSLLTNIWLLRILAALFGLGVVIFTFLTVNLIFEESKWPAIAATAFVAINPMFTHITTLVSNDSLFILLFSIFLFLLTKSVKEGLTNKLSIYLGLVTGLGMLTKFFFILAFPIILAAFLLFNKQAQLDLKKVLITFISPVIISGVYYLRNLKLYGVLQPVFKSTKAKGFLTEISFTKFIYLFSQKLFISFWSNFGWQYPRFGKSWHIFILSVLFVSFLGLIAFLVYSYRQQFKFKISTLFLSAIFLLTFVLAFYSYKELRLTGFVQGIQGRYFFTFIGPLGLFLYLGIRQILPFLRGKAAFIMLLVFMGAMDFSAIFYHILPKFYAIDGSILVTVIKASERAAQDWFRLGYLYLMSLLAYVLLVVAILGAAIYEKVKTT